MFDLFRSRDKVVRYVLGAVLGVVALAMVVTLIPGYGTPMTGTEQLIATVGDQDITIREVQQAIQNATRGRQIPEQMLPFYAPQIIDQMIAERAIAYQAERMGFRVSDEELANAIRSVLVQYFPDGNINQDAYRRFLAQQNVTVEEFERNMRQNILALRLQNLVLEGSIVSPEDVEREFRRKNDQIKLAYVAYEPKDLRSEVSVTEQELRNYFNANRASFTVPERRSFHLVIADEGRMGAAMQVSEEQLRAAYAKNMERYRTPERVRARHILLKTTGKSPEETAKIEQRAKDLLQQVRSGADFAELAKKNSEDTGSAVQGGDLGWIVRGQTVPNFERAAFSLKPNEISDVIKTEYGYHIIQTLEKQQPRVRPFEEVRAELETEYKREAVYNRMQEAMDRAREELQKNPSQAAAIASKYGLNHYQVDNLASGEPVPEVGANPELQTALAGTKQGQVTEVIQVGPSKLAVATVTGYTPSRQAEFAEVEAQVRERVINERVLALRQKRLQEARDKVAAAGGDLQAAAKAVGAEVKETQFFPFEGAADGIGPASYVAEAFTKPVGSVIGPVTAGDKVILAKVIEKKESDPKQLATERSGLLLSLKQRKAQERRALFEAGLVDQLVEQGKITKYQENIDRLLQSLRSS